MRYLSVCSGIEAATMAWQPLGWTPAAFAEIDKFPSAVLAHRYGSNMPGDPLSHNAPANLGDITKFKEWDHHDIDLLVGGTPCQSFSIAGLRKGLDDPRGNLMLTYAAIAKRYQPRWLVWENVPGVLSSNGGRDFGSFLRALAECGYGFAYRVLDAQFIRVDGYRRAVPQRRRRVFVVGYLGDWERAAAVLFEPEGLRGDTAPRREEGQRTAGTVNAGAHPGSYNGQDAYNDLLVTHALRCEGFDVSEDGTGRGKPIVPIAIQERAISENPNSGPDGVGVRQDGAAYTLEARQTPQAVAFDMRGREGGAQFEGPHDTANIRAASGGSSRSYVAERWAVRRLTPVECHRLQGFPDDFCNIPWRGKDFAPDGPQYKALGNSMAVNCMAWIGQRIQMVEDVA